MQVTELSNEGLKRQFKIVVPAGELSAKVDERLAELAQTAAMPGFRPGKVPVGLLKKQYGQALYGEALEAAVNQSTAKAIEDRGLKPAMQPKVDLKELGEGKDVEFEVALEVLPEIGQLDFSGVELERLKATVPGVTVSITGGPNRPPMPASASAQLLARTQAIAEQLGLPALTAVAVGGASDGNFTAAIGTPTLDGLGAVGEGAHAEREYALVSAMPERAALVAELVRDLLHHRS